MCHYLDSVSVGQYGGLGVYRPVPGQSPTPAMTAEAFAMRNLLGYPFSPQAEVEAKALILKNLPGRSEENWYYWYYASLAMFPYQDQDWQVWNNAMKNHLTQSQITSGPDAGSWDTRCIWSGYGGRIYSTAIACLSLEVYYRYLPMYRSNLANSVSQWDPLGPLRDRPLRPSDRIDRFVRKRDWSWEEMKVGPAGFEPATKGLCLPLRLSSPLSGLWSGPYLHFTCLPSGLYTFSNHF